MPKRTNISSILIVGGVLNLAGSSALAQPARADPPAAALAQQRATLDRIAERCHLPKSIFHFDRGGTLHFKPRPSEHYQRIDCALGAIREAGLSQELGMMVLANEAAH